jgi:putative DNA primase/helicase
MMVDFTVIFGGPFDAAKYREGSGQAVDVFSARDDFLSVIKSYGIVEQQIEDGKIVRCATTDSKGKKPAWYLFNCDSITGVAYGAFGDWRDGETHNWRSSNHKALSATEQSELQARIDAARKLADIERQKKHDEAAKEAAVFIEHCQPAAGHDYLNRKKVRVHGNLYIDNKSKDLIIPLYNIDGELRSYQRIPADPNKPKLFADDAQTKGCFYFIGQDWTGPTYIAEGYATAATIHELTGKAVVVAFYAHNIKTIAHAIRAKYPTLHIVIAADNDHAKAKNTGIDTAKAVCESITSVSYIAPQFPAGNPGTDWNDFVVEFGAEAAKKQLFKVKARIELAKIGDLGDIKKTEWLIENILPTNLFFSLYGPSGHGKTFAVLDLACHIATGQPWHGRETKQGSIVYICGEGRSGIQKRIHAWCKHYSADIKSLPFYITNRPIPFLDKSMTAEFIETLTSMMEQCSPVRMIIVDTLNRNFGDGNENSTEDMTRFVDACGDVQRAFSTGLMVVHHTGLQDSSRARGSGVLRNATDVEMQFEK